MSQWESDVEHIMLTAIQDYKDPDKGVLWVTK